MDSGKLDLTDEQRNRIDGIAERIYHGLNRKQRRAFLAKLPKLRGELHVKPTKQAQPADSQHQSLPEGIHELGVGEAEPKSSTEAYREASQGF